MPHGGAILSQVIVELAKARDERLVFILFDRSGQYICSFERHGTHAGIALNFRDLMERALANAASGLLLLHNHPSGDPAPSDADVEATRMLEALCRPLELTLHDHLIVGRGSVTSLRRAGLIMARMGTVT